MAQTNPQKNSDLQSELEIVHRLYPTCTDFERDFLSLTFALATGVGKTRLMGAFIAYLYTHYDIKNFFVVAPNTTIYEKLKKDLSDTSSPKYVFRGLGCFDMTPLLITNDDYKEKSLNLFNEETVNIFVYNIDKFNKENSNMRHANEMLGESFYQILSQLPDLVLIMDESHHYRAARGMQALNDLHPLLGLELTATPLVTKGSRQIPFKNVVYEYPLSQAIADGYTRTPYAVTRSDINFYNFGEEQLDKLMLQDGLLCHENTKAKLQAYANNENQPLVKPFMLIVCRDTDHAQWVESYIKSNDFQQGRYRDKVIVIHSKQRGAESEENTRLLLHVEQPDNPVEIVIHVNMLKEGWDVNNLYTIVPLRTAASKILREQMVGRGLRLPYGKRTGHKDIDAVMLTAHDKFQDILAEAQRGDSIFKAGNIIHAETIQQEKTVPAQLALDFPTTDLTADYADTGLSQSELHDRLLHTATHIIQQEVQQQMSAQRTAKSTADYQESIVAKVKEELSQHQDLGQAFAQNANPLLSWLGKKTKKIVAKAQKKYIPIPRIKITDAGPDEYNFEDFTLDLTPFDHEPIANEMIIQNLENQADIQRIQGNMIDFEGYRPKNVILSYLRLKPEIDYENCNQLLFKLITAACNHYEMKFGSNGMQNIVMMYKKDIAEKIYQQMMQHFSYQPGMFKEEVIDVTRANIPPTYTGSVNIDLYTAYEGDIHNIIFQDINKGVFSTAKFDSRPELLLARILESDPLVQNWLRPASGEFNIIYNHGHRYEPDFVVETEELIYLVEVKGEDKLHAPDVLAKKERSVSYCQIASAWCKANHYKEWRYLFIPSQQIRSNSTFKTLSKQFAVQ